MMRSVDPALLREFRRKAGLTQAEVAELVGVARTNYVSMETGRLVLGVRVLPKVAKALGCKPRDLFADNAVTLRDLRESAAVTQAEAAKALGYATPLSYRRIERGEAKPPKGATRTLALLFDASERRVQAALTNL